MAENTITDTAFTNITALDISTIKPIISQLLSKTESKYVVVLVEFSVLQSNDRKNDCL